MTAREWDGCTDTEKLLGYLTRRKKCRASDRKFRLFTCAACRLAWKQFKGSTVCQKAVETVERFADGGATADEVSAADNAIVFSRGLSGPWGAARWATWGPWRDHDSLAIAVRAVTNQIRGAIGTADPALETVCRCIFGNPFRPVAFTPAWRTDTAIALARQMYDSREFGAMPILADALQDAGCEDEQVLSHCRDAGPHARGCWVVDGVLGNA